MQRNTRVRISSFGLLLLAFMIACTWPVAAKTTISYSAWGNDAELGIDRALIAAFEKLNPDVTVELRTPSAGYEESLAVWIAGGAAPDVISLNRQRFPEFAGALQPVNMAGIDASAYAAPMLVQALQINGKQYGLPKRMNTKTMIYDVDAFDTSALAYPTDKWTPDNYASAAKKLTLVDADKVTRWGSGPLVIWNWFTTFGGSLFNADMTKAQLLSPEIQAATTFMAGLHKRYAGWFDDFPNFDAALAGGKMAMFADVGPWYVPALVSGAGFNWKLALIPGKQLEPELTALAISGTTKNYEAAWRFVKFVSNSEQGQDIVATGTNLPVGRKAITKFTDRVPKRGLEKFFDVFNGYQFPALSTSKVSRGNIDGTVWDTFYNEILPGKIDPVVGLTKLQTMAQAVLDQQKGK